MTRPGGIAHTALQLAHQLEYPSLDIDHYLQELQNLADRARQRVADPFGKLRTPPLPSASILALNHVLYEEEGFVSEVHGQTSNDARHYFLNEVLERREGAPLLLAQVYLEVGRRMGLPLAGAAMPFGKLRTPPNGSFLVAWPVEGKTMLIDPANQGNVLSPRALLQRLEAGGNDIFTMAPLLKFSIKNIDETQYSHLLLQALRAHYHHAQRWKKLLLVLNELLIIQPRNAELWHQRSETHTRLECPQAALRDYQRALRCLPRQEQIAENYQRRLLGLQAAAHALH